MRVENMYDKHLQAIEEAEDKVRLAKLNLQEAEAELDETLSLVEAELQLDEKLFDDEGDNPEFIIEIKNEKNNWVHVGQTMEKGKGVVYSLAANSKPKTFKSENAAKGSGIWDQLVKDGYRENETLRVSNQN